MKFSPPMRRRMARDLCRVGAIGSAVMLVLGAATALDVGRHAVYAAPINGGDATILGAPPNLTPITTGGSATPFVVRPPAGAACTGDSATGGYRVQGYVVAGNIDPSTLTFQPSPAGPIPVATGAAFRQPLFTTTTQRYSFITTGIASTAGGPGPLASTPAFSFSYLGSTGATLLPPGTYNVGLACTIGPASATQLDKYWNVQMTFAADPADPAGIKWTVGAPVVDTTTTTTVDPATTTTTTIAGATTTTTTTTSSVPGATTTSTLPRLTTTTVPAAGAATSTSSSSSSTTVVSSGAGTGTGTGSQSAVGSGGSPSGGSFPVSAGTLPRTGSSPTALVVWGVLLLIFGRMAILLGRKPRVI
jgi:hypothetical protein